MEARVEEEPRPHERFRRRKSGSRYSMSAAATTAGITWAVITGASSGIGQALAYEFAAGGFNLLLIGRNEAGLGRVVAECASKYKIEAEFLTADLSRTESVDALITALQAKPRHYEVLVNN